MIRNLCFYLLITTITGFMTKRFCLSFLNAGMIKNLQMVLIVEVLHCVSKCRAKYKEKRWMKLIKEKLRWTSRDTFITSLSKLYSRIRCVLGRIYIISNQEFPA